MTDDSRAINAKDLIDALQVSGAITPEQTELLKNAMTQAGSKPPEQVFSDSGLFPDSLSACLAIPLKLLDEKRLSANQLALYLMSHIQGRQSPQAALEAALGGIEAFATPPRAEGLLPIIDALVGACAIDKRQLEDLQKRMADCPDAPWDEQLLALAILTPREIECAKLGQALMEQGQITKSQFAVAFFDERTNSAKFEKSLQERGWWQKTPS